MTSEEFQAAERARDKRQVRLMAWSVLHRIERMKKRRVVVIKVV